MKSVNIEYDWSTGNIREKEQDIIEVTSDIVEQLDKYDLMFRKVNGEIIVMRDIAGGQFRQR